MAGDEYIPCLKCDAWVPHYAKEIHMAECHELALKQFSHPYITGCSLYGQVTMMGGSEQSLIEAKEKGSEVAKSTVKTNKTIRNKTDESNHQNKKHNKLSGSKVASESQVAEPEWVKKILPTLQYRAVVMNERDLIRCNITAYTAVEVRVGDVSCAFLAIPEECVHIGHLMLHQGCTRYVPEVKDNALICVKKIECVQYVDELRVESNKTFTSEENSYFEKQVKAFMYSSYPLGAPFTVSVGCNIHLPSLNNTAMTFTVQSYTLTESLHDDELTHYQYRKQGQDLMHEKSDTIPSQLITIDECEGSVSQLTDKVSNLHISTLVPSSHIQLEESVNISNCEDNIWTSTPKKAASGEGNQHDVIFTSKTNRTEISAINGRTTESGCCGVLEKVIPWVRTGRNTKVILHPGSVGKVDEHLHQTVGQDEYCKDQTYHTLKNIMQTTLQRSTITDCPLLGQWSGVLVYGPPGTGKTFLVHEVAAALSVPVFTLTLAAVSKSRSAKEHVQYMFWAACQSAPSVLFMDEVESLCPATDLKAHADRTLTPVVLQGIQTLQTSARPVFVVGATSQPARVSPKLRSAGRLERELMVPLPDAQQRGKIFQQLMSTHHHDLTKDDINSIAKRAYGFSGADLSVLVRCAWLACAKRTKAKEDLKLSREDMCGGMQNIVPTMLRHNYSAVSMVKWHDIWGYQDIKIKLQKTIGLYNHNPEKHPLKGLLLYGPPGCSKTMFVRALVHETSYSFFPLKCSNLLSKYVGETEKLLSQVFMRAQLAAPSVVFMDEVDSLCGQRADGASLVSELLSLMAQPAVQRNIMVIGATNRPHAVDEALLRPGFLEQVIHVDLPDFESRCAIWNGVLEGVPQDGSINVAKLSQATAGYSGAEITAVYQEAAFTALDKYIKDCDEKPRTATPSHPISLNEDLLMTTVSALPPRTPPSLLDSIASFTNQRNNSLLNLKE